MKTLSDIMKKRGLSQGKLSKLSGVSQATISRTLQGVYTPSVATYLKLKAVLGEELTLQAITALKEKAHVCRH